MTRLDPERLTAARTGMDGAGAKVRHALKHVGSLRYQSNKWLRGIDVPVEPSVEGGWFVARAGELPDPPESLALLAGDLVHDLRGALDHAVYQLARLTLDDPNGTQFPIFTDLAEYTRPRRGTQSLRDRYLTGVPEEYRQFVDALQPFHSPDPARDRLALLSAFSNFDKHRLIQAAYFLPPNHATIQATSLPPQVEWVIEYAPPRPLQSGDSILRFRPSDHRDLEHVQESLVIEPKFHFDVAWGPHFVTFPELHAMLFYVLRIVATLGLLLKRPDGLPSPTHSMDGLRDPDLDHWLSLTGD